jgi:hypothetical protein
MQPSAAFDRSVCKLPDHLAKGTFSGARRFRESVVEDQDFSNHLHLQCVLFVCRAPHLSAPVAALPPTHPHQPPQPHTGQAWWCAADPSAPGPGRHLTVMLDPQPRHLHTDGGGGCWSHVDIIATTRVAVPTGMIRLCASLISHVCCLPPSPSPHTHPNTHRASAVVCR